MILVDVRLAVVRGGGRLLGFSKSARRDLQRGPRWSWNVLNYWFLDMDMDMDNPMFIEVYLNKITAKENVVNIITITSFRSYKCMTYLHVY